MHCTNRNFYRSVYRKNFTLTRANCVTWKSGFRKVAAHTTQVTFSERNVHCIVEYLRFWAFSHMTENCSHAAVCVDRKFSPAVLRKASSVSSLSLSFSSPTTFRSAGDETISGNDNLRPGAHLQTFCFRYSPRRRCPYLIHIALERRPSPLTVYRRVHACARDRHRIGQLFS